MEAPHPLGLVRHEQRALSQWILCRHAGRTVIGVASLRLDAADCEHEAAGSVAPVGAEREHAGHIESSDDAPAGAQADGVAQARSDQTVMGKYQSIAQRRADMIDEF